MSTVPNRRGLGRGLEVLIGGGASSAELLQIPLGSIRANTRQPRRHIDADGISGLAESVRATERAARWAGAQTKPRKSRRIDPALAERARKSLEAMTGATDKVTDTRIEIPFADEVGLAEIVESLEARN